MVNYRYTEKQTDDYYSDLLETALNQIKNKAYMVIGPMFIERRPEENFVIFKKNQEKLTQEGKEVFDQIPFTDYLLKDAPFNYNRKFDIFYKGLIESGKIQGVYVLPGFEKSEGTMSEIKFCESAGVAVFYVND